jgi:hypothetical protein
MERTIPAINATQSREACLAALEALEQGLLPHGSSQVRYRASASTGMQNGCILRVSFPCGEINVRDGAVLRQGQASCSLVTCPHPCYFNMHVHSPVRKRSLG